ncbi:hypothetical protein MWN34_17225 [Ancylobacter sp. 6x-1]|uniref:Uncharacterized protein n=1 Tax=Ancylobacter crimeensis TaxID=2579147 RepID=A0ABT0DFA2_9HYPH|nr:hypothetical protein [Ancylobacter crimeensis]MCK0198642.1 hypothetical protein [Ancylobacter crimeensis]
MSMDDDQTAREKAERLAAALRENLRRRKAQARGRAAAPASSPDDTGEAADSPSGMPREQG